MFQTTITALRDQKSKEFGTSARSRAAPGRGPGRRHAVPGGLSGDDRAASHGSARQVHRDARDGPAGAERIFCFLLSL